MQVHTNKESRKKQPVRKPGPKRFSAPYDLATLRTIYSAPAKSHEEICSSSAAEEQRSEGHHPGEERVKMVD
jgi:hypothetical protein